MKKLFLVMIALTAALLSAGAQAPDTVVLVPGNYYGREAKVVDSLLRRYHYRKTEFADSLSSVMLDSYLASLDPSRTYFLASDIRSFDKYRFRLDDLTRKGDVTPAFQIFSVYRKRLLAQMDHILGTLISTKFDYSADEYFESDRDEAPWATSREELNNIWYRLVKNQALSLKLSGKKEEEIPAALRTRFERTRKTIVQFKSEDVFSLYLNALTEAFDPHTNYLSPRQSDLFKQNMSLSLEGIGARLQTDNDYTKIFEIVPGGPAEKSGKLHPNDYIIAVGQGTEGELTDVIGWRIDDVVKLIKGPKGTTVRVQIIPAATGLSGPTEVITMVREKIKLEDQAARKQVVNWNDGKQDWKLGVITLPNFYMDFDAYRRRDPNYRSTTRDVRKLIGEMQAEQVNGIVIDLRNNGGGSLTEAINLTGLFIKDGPVVQVKSSDGRVDPMVDSDRSVLWDGPLLVMTNRFSASASEIFAGAIQDYHRGVIFGESTYGKGTVQQVFDLDRVISAAEPVGELKITLQKFYRVTGSSTQHQGVMPDVSLPSAYEAAKFGESAYKSALPWDRIDSANYRPSRKVDATLIAQLNKSLAKRMKSDTQLKKYVSDTDELRKNISQTRVSLNEGKRRKEMEEGEKKKGQAPLDTKVNGKDVRDDDLTALKDEFLREGILLLAEMLTKKIG
ncbi:MAG: carboxy terminal-processing peptidase [Bacteroidota bacterium]